MQVIITLDNVCDPEGAARRIYAKWLFAEKTGFVLNAQDVIERAWFHYRGNHRKGRTPTAATTQQDIPGIIVIKYDDSTPQLKGSSPQKLVTALQYWEKTGEEW